MRGSSNATRAERVSLPGIFRPFPRPPRQVHNFLSNSRRSRSVNNSQYVSAHFLPSNRRTAKGRSAQRNIRTRLFICSATGPPPPPPESMPHIPQLRVSNLLHSQRLENKRNKRQTTLPSVNPPPRPVAPLGAQLSKF